MDVNFLGHVRLTNILVNQMIEENKRNDKIKVKKPDYSIVNIGSVQSFLGTPFRAPCKYRVDEKSDCTLDFVIILVFF